MTKRRGQSLVESALVLGAFMTLLVGMSAIGESIFVRQALADHVRVAARWGALHTYDALAIRNMALFGTQQPAPGDIAFMNLAPASVEVSNPGCPGPACRVSVAIPDQGIRCVEPVGNLIPAPAAAP
ncbi:MAG TPA: TadE family protein [Bryobacteraceae bacterium]|nr:TadE family protein [Bryobacteraceae bacterium]